MSSWATKSIWWRKTNRKLPLTRMGRFRELERAGDSSSLHPNVGPERCPLGITSHDHLYQSCCDNIKSPSRSASQKQSLSSELTPTSIWTSSPSRPVVRWAVLLGWLIFLINSTRSRLTLETSLSMSVGGFLVKLTEGQDQPWTWAAPFSGLGSWTKWKGESRLSPSFHCSLLPDSGCSVASCFLLPASASTHPSIAMRNCIPWTLQNKSFLSPSLLPFLPFVFALLRFFVATMGQVTNIHSWTIFL